MKIRGFLAVIVLSAVVVYFIWIAKAGKEQVVEEVKAFIELKQQVTITSMVSLAREITSFIAQEGRTPESHEEFRMLYAPLAVSLDAWGTAIKYERLSSENFRLISGGKDKTFSTDDDIVKHY